MIDLAGIYLEKARENLAAAASEIDHAAMILRRCRR
jgi:hypothetical protein